MLMHTQSNLDPGNCWQTCVACVLEIDPATMPAQEVFEWKRTREDGSIEWGPSYQTPLNAFLRKHHGLTYGELYEHQWPAVMPRDPGFHFLIGPTVRTPTSGCKHVVVARYGEMVWDVHPSRAGLTMIERWGVLAPFPEGWARTWNEIPCVCPACATEAA